ncbi:MAG TPA: hypothetical protein VH253_20400 [Phycisphaerae bacterium]|nr:hypothetical protein [Phycisphaerae bacterium]
MRCIVIVGILLMALGACCGIVDARPPDYEDISYIAARGGSYRATISCDSGEETLQLWVTLPAMAGEGEVLAVPAGVGDVSAQLERGPIVWRGRWPSEVLREHLMPMCFFMQCTQIYPFFWARFQPQLSYSAPLMEPADVEGFGLRCRVVTARSPTALRDAAAGFGLKIEPARIDAVAPFADGAHSFVLLRVADPGAYPHKGDPETPVWFYDDPAVMLTLRFPAAAPVLPARSPASTYLQGNMEVAVRGFYRLELPAATWQHVRYYDGPASRSTVNAAHIVRTEVVDPDVAYTRVDCSLGRPREIQFTKSESLRLWLDEAAIAVATPSLVRWFLALVWLGALSYVSGGAAGLITYRRWRGLARLGLWNFLTVVAVRVRVGRGVAGIDTRKHATVFTVFFSGTFMLLYTVSSWMGAWIFSGRAF